jgi:hypothetical protein
MNTPQACHHIKASGEQCGGVAQRGSDLCYFHQRERLQNKVILQEGLTSRREYFNRLPRSVKEGLESADYLHAADLFAQLDLPPLEDAAAVQQWLTALARGVATGQVPRPIASTVLYALQLSLQTAKYQSSRPMLHASSEKQAEPAGMAASEHYEHPPNDAPAQ